MCDAGVMNLDSLIVIFDVIIGLNVIFETVDGLDLPPELTLGCLQLTLDVNSDMMANILDVVELINTITGKAPAP